MSYELYIFGSAVRGEVAKNSDIDVLVITDHADKKSMFPESWSVYSKKSIEIFFSEGKLFAWHLYLDAKCIHCSESTTFLNKLGEPSRYKDILDDFCSLSDLLDSSFDEMKSTQSEVFEIGIIYTALRDIAMVASTALSNRPCFSRYSPYRLSVKFPIPQDLYELMIEARLTSTRGIEFTGYINKITEILPFSRIKSWVKELEKII
jgi:hypothetical protein